MKHPLQAILIAPDYDMRYNTLCGIKKISIREGDRDYRPGPLMIVDHEIPFVVQADVVAVRKCKLSEVTEEEYRADGFETRESLLAGMKIYYSQITWNSIVTIIRWDNVRGHMVDRKDYCL